MTDAIEAIERILAGGADADDLLRDVVAELGGRFGWAGIAFVEDDVLVLGPATGTEPAATTSVPISYEGRRVAELRVAEAAGGRELLEGVTERLAPFCLVGWDTGGEAWSP